MKRSWIDQDTGEIDTAAYIRDPVRDPDGPSVNIDRLTDRESWLGGFRACFGADNLHTGSVRALGVDVLQTEEDIISEPAHALIVGLPSQQEDALTAERLASLLRKMSRAVDRVTRKRR